MIQQDLRSVHGYVLGLASLILALFIPFIVLLFKIFDTIAATIILGMFFPVLAVVLGVIGLIKSLKQSTAFTKKSKILNMIAIIVGVILIAFDLYIFIKSGTLGGVI
jgi:hypothetical protein